MNEVTSAARKVLPQKSITGEYHDDRSKPGLLMKFSWDFRSDGSLVRRGATGLIVGERVSPTETLDRGKYTIDGNILRARLDGVEKAYSFTVQDNGDLITDDDRRIKRQ
jgi:hypothetical protein